MSQVDVDSGIENMEVEDSDRREKRNLAEKVNTVPVTLCIKVTKFIYNLAALWTGKLWSRKEKKTPLI